MNTNGWTFWQYLDENGRAVCLDHTRQRFVAAKTKGEG
jgi:hypothetical protein